MARLFFQWKHRSRGRRNQRARGEPIVQGSQREDATAVADEEFAVMARSRSRDQGLLSDSIASPASEPPDAPEIHWEFLALRMERIVQDLIDMRAYYFAKKDEMLRSGADRGRSDRVNVHYVQRQETWYRICACIRILNLAIYWMQRVLSWFAEMGLP